MSKKKREKQPLNVITMKLMLVEAEDIKNQKWKEICCLDANSNGNNITVWIKEMRRANNVYPCRLLLNRKQMVEKKIGKSEKISTM